VIDSSTFKAGVRVIRIALLCVFAISGICSEREASLYEQWIAVPERGDIKGYVLRAKDFRLSFIPPPKWNVKYDAVLGTATLLPPNLEAGISINVMPPRLLDEGVTAVERLREEIRSQHPDAVFTGEFACFAGGRQGSTVEFECRIEKDAVRTVFRRAVFEFDDGVVESELRAAGGRIAEFQSAYARLLSSLAIRFSPDRANLAFGGNRQPSHTEGSAESAGVWSD